MCYRIILYLFQNGTLLASKRFTNNLVDPNAYRIGKDTNAASNFNGHIDEFRIILGECKYAAAFTVESSAYTNPTAIGCRGGGGGASGDGSPSAESDSLMPKTAYGRRNALLEESFSLSTRLLGAQSLVLRVSNPFGPFQFRFRRRGLVQSLIHGSFTQQPIVLRGSGQQVRDYIYVGDLVSSLYGLICLENWPFKVLNIASGYSFSANEIVEVLKVGGFSPVVTLSSDSSKYDVNRSEVDNSRLCSALNIRPQSLYPFTDTKLWSLSAGLS